MEALTLTDKRISRKMSGKETNVISVSEEQKLKEDDW